MSSNLKITKICEFCEKEFEARTFYTRYCSHSCNRKHYKKKLREEKIDRANISFQTDRKAKMADGTPNYRYKDYFSITEVADYIGISRRTVYRLIKNKDLKIHKLGGRTIIKKSSIEALF
jgi:excisionase family DNA binding protein